MNFVVVGTDHRLQPSDPGLEGLLRAWLDHSYFEPLQAIAEEFHSKLGSSIAQRLAQERNITWFNVDMSEEEKAAAGILVEQKSRPISADGKVAYRVPSDDVRENAWIVKLTRSGAGTTLVICGYLHFDPLVERLRNGGHAVDGRVYLERVPKITDISHVPEQSFSIVPEGG